MKDASPEMLSIFCAAVERPAEERATFVEQACGQNVELRRRIEELLSAHDQAGGFLPEKAGVAATIEQTSPESPGTVIGPYKLLQQIGEGGMGTVYMAEQTQPVQRRVALKVIKVGMDSKQVIARFEAERQALAMMDHVNIARVFDGGATENGRPYFVMELVHGAPITKYCDDNHLTPRERLELFVPVCQAIQHAHQKGIIHRDIKPSNVLVTRYDGKPVPKVIDFGVAKATEQKLTERTLFTQYGTMVGTLEYMSPEQAEMSALGVDTRSDIYSLGVLLYELLTGSTPLTHKRMKEAAYAEILRMIKEEEPPKPSTRLSDSGEALASISANRHMEPGKLTKLVRGELDWIVMKTLEKDRNRRYETANGFAQDVQRYLADEPVQACPPSTWYRFRKFARRNKRALATVALLCAMLLVLSGSFGWMARDRAAQRLEAARQATESLTRARVLIDDNKFALARQELAEARGRIGRERAALPAVTKELEKLEAEVEARTRAQDGFRDFLRWIEQAHERELDLGLVPAGDRLGRESNPRQAVPLILRALALYGVIEQEDWSARLERALLEPGQVTQIRRGAFEQLLWLADDVFRRREDHQSSQKLSPREAAGQALAYLGRARTALPPTLAVYALSAKCQKILGEARAADANQQLADKTPPTMAVDHYLLGQASYDRKESAAAIKAFEAALRLEPAHYWSLMRLGYCLTDLGRGPKDFAAGVVAFTGCILKRPDHAYAYYCRGLALEKLDRSEEAHADFTKAIALDPVLAPAWSARGYMLWKLGRLDQALADLNKAIDLDPMDARPWANRGVIHADLGHRDEALADCNKAIELNPTNAFALSKRAMAYRKLGLPNEGLSDFTRVVELDPTSAAAWYYRGAFCFEELRDYGRALADFTRAVELDPQLATAWFTRGMAHGALGQPKEAVADYSKAIELDPTLVEAWYNRGTVYRRLGQPAEALADLTKAIELKPNHAMAWTNRGITYRELDQTDKALADYDKAIEVNPKLKYAWYNRGALYFDVLRQYAKAVADFTRAVELEPTYAPAWYTLGAAHYRTGNWKDAVAALDKSMDLRKGGDSRDWFFLAMAHRQLGNEGAARKWYDKAVAWMDKNQPKNETLRRFRAEAEELLKIEQKKD